MRVTFDSNAWEEVFKPGDLAWTTVREALRRGYVQGYICETGFKIEAIRKTERMAYFEQPAMDVETPLTIVIQDGKPLLHLMSLGPDDGRHPGVPAQQKPKLRAAFEHGVRLLRGMAWMGLPSPPETRDPLAFAPETDADRAAREQLQIDVYAQLEERGVGRAVFDAAGGWNLGHSPLPEPKKFNRACAEWADGEVVAAHIAYQNDVLCTDDRAKATGVSVFDAENRAWLRQAYGLRLATLAQLSAMLPTDWASLAERA